MGITSRMLRICKADLHGLVDRLEEPELLARHWLRVMRETLQDMAARLDRAVDGERRMKAEENSLTQEAEKLESDLDRALHHHKDDLARLIIRRLLLSRRQLQELRRQSESLGEERQRLELILADRRFTFEALSVRVEARLVRSHEVHAGTADPAQSVITEPADAEEEEVELELQTRKERLEQREGLR